MKKIIKTTGILALIILLVASLTGCVPSKLVGKWEDERDTVEFKSNGKFTSQVYFMNGTYEVNGNTVIMDIPLVGEEIYEFTVENDTLTLQGKVSGVNMKYTFKKK